MSVRTRRFVKQRPMDSIFEKMTSHYTRPSMDDQLSFIEALQQGQAAGILQVEFHEAEEADRLPWAPKEHVIDCDINFQEPSAVAGFGQIGRDYGSGCAEVQVSAAAHAACEALERILVSAGGMQAVRPSANTVWSVLTERWIHLPFNPLVTAATNRNPHYSRSGEAYHLIEGEALRAAYCEVLERDALNRALHKPESCDLITQWAVSTTPEAAVVAAYWDENGYDLRILLLPSPFAVLAVMAIARNRDDQEFRAVFKGVAADFTLERAVLQALSELGRNAFFGAAVACHDEDELQLALRDPKVPTVDKPNLALLSPRLRAITDPFWQTTVAVSESNVAPVVKSASPGASLLALKKYRLSDHSFDLWAIPIGDSAAGIPGYAWKIIGLGLNQNCHLYPNWKGALI